MKILQSTFFLLLLISCGDKVTEKAVVLGKTTFTELKKLLGEPQRVDNVAAVKVAVYLENEKYQIENDLVVAKFRAPFEAEKSLLYWKHLCRDEAITFRDLEKSVENHLKPEQEFSCKASKITVIYDPNIDKIVRVISYAP